MYARMFETRMGWAAIASRGQGISHVILPKAKKKTEKELNDLTTQGISSSRQLLGIESDLIHYFNGRPIDFSDYELDITYSSGFQKRVWLAAREIGYGKTTTYGDLAKKIGEPGAARAVGAALNKNPIPVIIPCHRILAANGLGGYSGGEKMKEKLLKLEGIL